jgi:hypothetical protein
VVEASLIVRITLGPQGSGGESTSRQIWWSICSASDALWPFVRVVGGRGGPAEGKGEETLGEPRTVRSTVRAGGRYLLIQRDRFQRHVECATIAVCRARHRMPHQRQAGAASSSRRARGTESSNLPARQATPESDVSSALLATLGCRVTPLLRGLQQDNGIYERELRRLLKDSFPVVTSTEKGASRSLGCRHSVDVLPARALRRRARRPGACTRCRS